MSDFTFTFHFHALEKEMATHSSVLAWRIPGTEEPGGLLSVGLYRVRHDWCYLAAAAGWGLSKGFTWLREASSSSVLSLPLTLFQSFNWGHIPAYSGDQFKNKTPRWKNSHIKITLLVYIKIVCMCVCVCVCVCVCLCVDSERVRPKGNWWL